MALVQHHALSMHSAHLSHDGACPSTLMPQCCLALPVVSKLQALGSQRQPGVHRKSTKGHNAASTLADMQGVLSLYNQKSPGKRDQPFKKNNTFIIYRISGTRLRSMIIGQYGQ